MSRSLRGLPGGKKYYLNLDGDGDYAVITGNKIATAISGSSEVTIEGWVKPTKNIALGKIFSSYLSTFALKIDFNIDANQKVILRARSISTDNIQSVTTNDAINLNTWTHIAGTIDLATNAMKIYVNSAEKATTGTPSFGQTTFSAEVGGRDVIGASGVLSDSLIGKLRELRIWNYARTQEQIEQNMYNAITEAEGLISRYAMDEKSGSTLEDTAEPINLLTENQANGGEDGTTGGFSVVGASGTLSSSTDEARQGSRSIKFITNNAAANEGYSTSTRIVSANTTCTGSVWLKGTGGTVRLFINEYTLAGAYIGESYTSIITLTGTWTRYKVSRAFGANGERAALVFYTTAQQSITFYADGFMLYKGSLDIPWLPADKSAGGYDAAITGATWRKDRQLKLRSV